MKRARLFAIALTTVGLIKVAALAEPGAAAAGPPEWLKPLIRAVENSASVSAVIAAYARGKLVDVSNPHLLGAYVRRLVELGLPEAAFEPARRLVAIDPDNGLARAVVAQQHLRLGELAEALSAAMRAARLSGEEPFVLRTAAEVIAHYDRDGGRTELPAELKALVAKVREQLASRDAFVNAYLEARSQLEKAEALARMAEAAADYQGLPAEAQKALSDETEVDLKKYEREFPCLTGKRTYSSYRRRYEYRGRYHYEPYYYPYPYYDTYRYCHHHHRYAYYPIFVTIPGLITEPVLVVIKPTFNKHTFPYRKLISNNLTDNRLISYATPPLAIIRSTNTNASNNRSSAASANLPLAAAPSAGTARIVTSNRASAAANRVASPSASSPRGTNPPPSSSRTAGTGVQRRLAVVGPSISGGSLQTRSLTTGRASGSQPSAVIRRPPGGQSGRALGAGRHTTVGGRSGPLAGAGVRTASGRR